MKVLAPTTAFPRFPGDVNGHFILEMFNRIKDVEFEVITPSDPNSEQHEKIENVSIKRVSYMPSRKLQKLTYGEGIHANLQKSHLAKLQVPLLGITLLNNIMKDIKNHDLIHAQMVFAGYASHLARQLSRSKIPLIVSFYGKDILNCKQNLPIYRSMLEKADLMLALSKDIETMPIIANPKNKTPYCSGPSLATTNL